VPESPALSSPSEAALAPRLEQKILPGLERIRHALAELGHPELSYPSVLVLGTNGKGSTAVLLAGVLAAQRLRVGLYTSPHLVRVEERIRIGGATIASERLLELLNQLARFPSLSYFETLTAAAFLQFAGEGVDVAILEAGLGGRWDATNAADPVVTLLTNVGTDHQTWLGTTRAEIAAEKAAALRGREAIVGAWDAEVEPVIRASADPATPLSLASEWAVVTGDRGPGTGDREKPTTIERAEESAHGPRPTAHAFPVVRFAVAGISGSASLPLLGRHQEANLALALAGAAALARRGVIPALRADAITAGVQAAEWPGRLQWLESSGGLLLLDGAHNIEAVHALAAALADLGLAGKVNLLFSCLDDKPLAAMAALLRPLVERVTVVALDSPRATAVGALAEAFPGCAVEESITAALAHLPNDTPTLVTGSLRLVGEVLRATGSAKGR
jgi:dihydrofolate synthase/folylpolyglutamate synthase